MQNLPDRNIKGVIDVATPDSLINQLCALFNRITKEKPRTERLE